MNAPRPADADRGDTYPSLAAYTADVIAARNAYAADQNDLCHTCQTRKRDIGADSHECWTCRHQRRHS